MHAEVVAFGDVVAALSFGVKQESPSPEVKDRLHSSWMKSRASENDGRAGIMSASQFLSVRADEGEWREVQEGVLIKQLFIDNKSGIATALVRMMPGTSLPRHRHGKAEQFYVLEGDCTVQGEELGPGDYHCAGPGSIHATTYTVGGTLLLLVAPERYEVLQDNQVG